jgi:ribulose-phosphate 3-epimerase
MNLIREAGATAGVALNPGTAVEALAVGPDLALCMTVNPGWGGQPFIEGSIDRHRGVCAPRSGRTRRSRSTAASAPATAGRCAAAGATTFVAARRSSRRTIRPRRSADIAAAADGAPGAS